MKNKVLFFYRLLDDVWDSIQFITFMLGKKYIYIKKTFIDLSATTIRLNREEKKERSGKTPRKKCYSKKPQTFSHKHLLLIN